MASQESAKMADAANTKEFSKAETKLITIAFKHMDGIPTNIDFDAVAKEYGYKNGQIARNKFSLAKSKHKSSFDGEGEQEHDEDDPITPKSNKGSEPATPRKRKPANAATAKGSPTVKRRKSGKISSATVAAENSGTVDDGVDFEPKPVKTEDTDENESKAAVKTELEEEA